jgi:hypothetical protein
MKPLLLLLATAGIAAADWPPAKSPVIPAADGYVAIPNVALPPSSAKTYRAVFDATRAADKATQLVPVLNMAGSELNALAVARVPWRKQNSPSSSTARPSMASWTTPTTK